MNTPRGFKVGVFGTPAPKARDGVKLTAYTTWYSASWDGCCEHRVVASTGAEAKRTAMDAHRRRCLPHRYETDGAARDPSCQRCGRESHERIHA